MHPWSAEPASDLRDIFFALHDYCAVGYHRGNRANGRQHRRRDSTHSREHHRYFHQCVAGFGFDDQAVDVGLVDKLFHLIYQFVPRYLYLFEVDAKFFHDTRYYAGSCWDVRLIRVGYGLIPIRRYDDLPDDELAPILEQLHRANRAQEAVFPGDMVERQPVHVVYGGANLFKSGTPSRLGELALDSLWTNAADPLDFAECLGLRPELAEAVYSRVCNKLRCEPVEDYRLDFEDGYGYRPDAEEDAHAVSAARQLAAGIGLPHFPSYVGFRIKPLSEALLRRSLRTFQRFMGALLEATSGKLPDGFVVTLPKITCPAQVAAFADVLDKYELRAGLAPGSLRLELMIESPRAIATPDGRVAIPEIIGAARGRCRGVHFGAYDYTSELSISSMCQSLSHSACDFVRDMMQACLAGRGVMLSDSVTATLPVPVHRGSREQLTAEQLEENRVSVWQAWKLHFGDTRRSLARGFYQGWDLHPAQLPTRYAAVYSFFLEGLPAASARLRNFVEKAAQATLVGSAFDDAASGQGLLNFFLRGLNCGAITEQEALRTGLTLEELRGKSFAAIAAARRPS